MLQFDMLTEHVDKVRPNRPPKPPPAEKLTSTPVEPPRATAKDDDVPSTSA